MNVTAAVFSGTNAGAFSLTALPAAIAPGGTGILKISFNPAGISGAVEAVLELTSNSAVNPVKAVLLTGFIHDPKVISLTERMEFGTFPAGSGPQTKNFTLRNDGAAQTLNISEITPAGLDAGAFNVTAFPASLAPGATGTVEVVFDPLTEDGSFVSRMTVVTDDPLTPSLTVVLHAEVPVSDALVAWWPLDTGAEDATGNGFDGLVLEPGTVTFGEAGAGAATGTSADFSDGGHIDVEFDPRLNPTSFTVTLWAQADGTAGYASPVTSRVHGGGGETYGYIIYNTDGGNWAFWTGQGVPNWDDVTGPAATPGAWTHLAVTYDAATDTKTLWINGESAAVDAARTAPTQYTANTTQSLHIGAGDDNGLGFPFDGKLDDIALYKKALSQSEIQNIMNNGAGGLPAAGGDFVINSVARDSAAGHVTLLWTSRAGEIYTIQRSENLANWTDLTPAVTGGGGTIANFTDTAPPANSASVYYRIKRAAR